MVVVTPVGTIVRIFFCLVMFALMVGIAVGNRNSGPLTPSPSVSHADQTHVVRADERQELTKSCKIISCSG
jgi:hypothetical protein